MSEITDFTTGYSETTEEERDAAERKRLVSTTKLTGWAGLMLFAVFAGGIVSFALSFKDVDVNLLRAHPLLGSVDILNGAVLFVTSLIAGIQTCRRARNAVFWLRVFFVILFVSNIIALVANGGFQGLDSFEAKSLIRGLVWPVIWIVFTFKSMKLAEALPHPWRKTSRGDILASILLFALPIMAFAIGYRNLSNAANGWYDRAEYTAADLPEGYATDGRIKFAILDGATAEPLTYDGVGPWAERKDGVFSGEVLSGVFTSMDKGPFFETMETVLDEGFKEAKRTIVSDTTCTISSHDAHLHFESLELDGDTYRWRFAMLYAPEKGKIAVLSFYDGIDGKPEYFHALLESIQF
jgi:hypothetical protein